MATCLQVLMVPSTLRSSSSSYTNSSSSSSSFDMNPKIGWRNVSKRLNYSRCSSSSSSSNIPKLPIESVDLNDPFIKKLTEYVQANPEMKPSPGSENPPFLDLFNNPTMSSSSGAHGDINARSGRYGLNTRYHGVGVHKTKSAPPDIPSVLLDERIIYLGMPMVSAVTELMLVQFMYLEYVDDTAPIFLYINSTGTARDDNQVVGHDGEGFAIYDTMMQVNNEVETICISACAGYACLLLAAGKLGRRFMLPHARIAMKKPHVPATGLMQASDVFIQAKEASLARDLLFKLFAYHTGHRLDDIKEKLKNPLYMGAKEALEFGVVDKILWQGQKDIVEELVTPEQWAKLSIGKGINEP